MDFAAQTQSAESNIFMIIMIVGLFVANFWFCRNMSIKLVASGMIRKHPIVKVVNKQGKIRNAINTKVTSDEFKKLFLFWFVPVFGALSLIVLYISIIGMKYVRAINTKLFLNHM